MSLCSAEWFWLGQLRAPAVQTWNRNSFLLIHSHQRGVCVCFCNTFSKGGVPNDGKLYWQVSVCTLAGKVKKVFFVWFKRIILVFGRCLRVGCVSRCWHNKWLLIYYRPYLNALSINHDTHETDYSVDLRYLLIYMFLVACFSLSQVCMQFKLRIKSTLGVAVPTGAVCRMK